MYKPIMTLREIMNAEQPSGEAVRSSELVRRFSDKQAELAAKISNDIAEDIDSGESRKSLRMAVAYWADVACVESQRRAKAESTVAIFKSAKALMDVVLPPNCKLTDSRRAGGGAQEKL